MAGKNDAQIAQVKKVKEFKRQHKLYFFRLWLNHWLAEGELGSLAFLISAPAAFWFGLNAYFGEKDCISYTIIFGTIFLFLLTRKPVYKLIWRSVRQWNVEGMTDSIDRFWGTGKYQNTNNYYYEEKQAKKEAAYLEYYARKQEAYNRNSYQAKTARNRANAAAARAKQYR